MANLKENIMFADNYLLIKQIGLGGFAEVWAAKDTQTDLTVAIKIYIRLDKDGQEQAKAEFKKAFKLTHSNVLTPSYFNIYEGQPFIVMTFCSQGTALKKAGKIQEDELAKLILHISSSIEYIHSINPAIIHRDIKPDNFLIDDNNNYLLTDFGISNEMRRTLTKSVAASRKTIDKKRMESSGTAPNAYRAPELFSKDYSQRKPIKANDIFSFGVSLFEMTTADFPFGEMGGTMLYQTGLEVPNIPDNYSDGLNNLIKRCLSKEPWDRPTATEIKEHAQYYQKHGHWNVKKVSSQEELKQEYKTLFEAFYEDGDISTNERNLLTQKQKELKLTNSEIQEIEKNIIVENPPKGKGKKIVLAVVSSVVIIAIILGVYFINKSANQEKFTNLYNSGTQLYESGNFTDAKNKFLEAKEIETNPELQDKIKSCIDSIETGYNNNIEAGNNKTTQKEYLDAILFYKKALTYKPNNETAKEKLSSLSGKIEDLYKKAIEKGKKLLSENNFEEAKKEFEKAKEIKPTNNQTSNLLAKVESEKENAYSESMKKGNVFLQNKKYSDAKRSFNQALLYKPNDPSAKNKISEIPQRFYNKPRVTKGKKGKYPNFELLSVEITDNETIVSFRLKNMDKKKNSFSIYSPQSSDAFYIKDYSGNTYNLKKAKGISFGENQRINGSKRFSLIFEKIPSYISKIDIIEGKNQIIESMTYWNFKGVILK